VAISSIPEGGFYVQVQLYSEVSFSNITYDNNNNILNEITYSNIYSAAVTSLISVFLLNAVLNVLVRSGR